MILNGIEYSEDKEFDLSKPIPLVVTDGKNKKQYMVYVHSFTGLPVLWIETDGRQKITSKTEYLRASFKLEENVLTRAPGDIVIDSVSIKGRGNTTWEMPKKPYRLKLDNKQTLLGEASDKSWVLLNNYADKTMLRTETAFFMGRLSKLDYTPSSHFVELFLNGQYDGTYQLCDKIKVSRHRVNVGDDGFLLEFDAKAEPNDITFVTSHLEWPINIKHPTVEYGDADFEFVTNYVSLADSVLFSSGFRDINEGWQKYFDIDSFVDWYLINEITKNTDANLYSSCYMSLARNGKLKMGPLWDFDISLGNVNYHNNYIPSGFWVKNTPWFTRLFKDPLFVKKVKERFLFFYNHKDDIFQEINNCATYLRYSIQENENRWHSFYTYTWPNYDIWGTYLNEIQYMKNWLNNRFEWLKTELEMI